MTILLIGFHRNMQRRGRPLTRRAAARAPAPAKEYFDESVNVPTPLHPPCHLSQQCQRVDLNEEIFQVMGCTEEQMVTYSAFLLKDRAKNWWNALQRRHPEGVSWADFTREFSEKFYPKSYRDARVEEFFILEQDSMSVADYERRFSELIRVVPYIADNEEEKVNRFAVGLNPKIRAYVASAAHI
ncbi:hypothetical protein ACOSQ3_016999 [Xanthoceras sorbifolium]